jgi:hypothetical protein
MARSAASNGPWQATSLIKLAPKGCTWHLYAFLIIEVIGENGRQASRRYARGLGGDEGT